jgi:hypothetical protein
MGVFQKVSRGEFIAKRSSLEFRDDFMVSPCASPDALCALFTNARERNSGLLILEAAILIPMNKSGL